MTKGIILKHFLGVLAIVAVLGSPAALLAKRNELSLATCNVGGKRYDAIVTPEEIQQSPSWPDTEEFPPLSPRKAIAAAIPVANSFGAGGRVTGVALKESFPGKWIYIVGFVHGPANGPVELSNVVVLMNGHAVQPTLFSPVREK
jgi:hypothetical protein